MNGIKILQTSMYVPKKIMTNTEISEYVDTTDDWIFKRTGIKERRISEGENTSDLCAEVCKILLKQENISSDCIDLLIVATITPDYLTPSTSCLVQSKIGAKNAVCFDLSAACTGFVYSLSVAEKMLKSGHYKNAIIVGAEVFSKILDWSDRRTCVLFGDGAGGILITKSDTSCILSESLHSDGSKAMSLCSHHMPINNPYINQSIQTLHLEMVGKDIFDFATKHVPANILNCLQKCNTSLDEIKLIIPHQANLRIVEAFAKKLNICIDKFYMNIEKFGNTSAATIPIALDELIKNNILSFGSKDKILLTGFGAGVTWGSMVIEL